MLNKVALRSYKNQYTKTSNGRYISYKASANVRGHSFELQKEEFVSLITGDCHYCGKKESNGIDRKDSSIGYTTSNAVPCCKTCNYMKGTLKYDDFLNHISVIYKNIL